MIKAINAALALLIIGSASGTGASLDVPKFDARPGCQAGADPGLGLERDVQACMASELAARNTLVQRWAQFTASDKAECTSLTLQGGPPSYIELLTCVEMAQEARSLHLD